MMHRSVWIEPCLGLFRICNVSGAPSKVSVDCRDLEKTMETEYGWQHTIMGQLITLASVLRNPMPQ